jgi:type IV secretion system protein VirD4
MSAKVNLIMRSGFAPIKARQYIWYAEKKMKRLPQKKIELPKQGIQKRSFVRLKADLLESSSLMDSFD